jgi:hypothetical protein
MSNTIDLTTKKKKINFNDFEAIKCTYSYYGNLSIDVCNLAYNCPKCDPLKHQAMCEWCLQNCHKQCIGNEYITGEMSNFVCMCHKNFTHKIQPTQEIIAEKENDSKVCLYSVFQGKFNNNIFYKCTSCKAVLCSLCRAYCKCPDYCNAEFEESSSTAGQCSCSCLPDRHLHSGTYFMDINEDIKKCCSGVNLVNPFQLLSLFLEKGLMKNLVKQLTTPKIDINYYYQLTFEMQSLPQLIRNFFKYRKYLFYLPKILTELYPYETIYLYMNKLKAKALHPSESFTLFYQPYMLLYVHLKQDFQNIKKLSTRDLLNSSIEERLIFNTAIRSYLTEPQQIKYKIFSKQEENKGLLSIIFKYLDADLKTKMGMDSEAITNLVLTIYYCLKINLFDLKQLILVIKGLFNKIDQIVEKMFNDNEHKVYMLKLMVRLAFSYNDMQFEALIYDKNGKRDFIQSQSEHGQQLIKMILCIANKFGNNFSEPEADRNHMYLLNEAMKLFILTDNVYHRQIKATTRGGLINGLAGFKNLLELTKQQGLSKFIFTNLINSIETTCEQLFRLNGNNDTLDEVIKSFDVFFESYNVKLSECEIGESDLQLNKKFVEKVKSYCTNIVPFVTDERFNRQSVIENFTNAVIITNLDEYLTKLFILVNNKENDNRTKIVDTSLSLLSLMFLSSRGTSYILKGKTISRILSIYSTSKRRITDFYYLLLKSCQLHNITLTDSRNVQIICGQLFESLTLIDTSNINNKIEIIRIFKIFTLSHSYIDYNDYRNICNGVLKFLKTQNFLEKDLFNKNFEDFLSDSYCLENTKSLINKEYNSFKEDNNKIDIITDRENNLTQKTDANKILFNNYIDDPENEKLIIQELYLTSFKLFKNDLAYVYKTEVYNNTIEQLSSFTSSINIKLMLSKSYLSLSKRTTVLNYLIKLFFIEFSQAEYDYNEYSAYLSPTEYYYAVKGVKEDTDYSYCKDRYDYAENLICAINVLKAEIENMFYFIFNESANIFEIRKYVEFLVLAVKHISLFLLGKKLLFKENFMNHIVLDYYKLAYAFLIQLNLIKGVLRMPATVDSVKSFLFSYLEQEFKETDNLKKLKELTDFFDINTIYTCVNEELTGLETDIEILDKSSLKKFLYNSQIQSDKDFFTIGLSFQGEYANFTDTIETQVKNKHEKVYQTILNIYENQLMNFHKSNIIRILQFNSLEDTMNYREILINFFKNYIVNRIYLGEEYEISLFTMINKIIYFDTPLEMLNLLNPSENQNFFYILYKKMEWAINLSYYTNNNIFIIDRYSNFIDCRVRLIVKFIQLLGENFNLNFLEKIIKANFYEGGKISREIVKLYPTFNENMNQGWKPDLVTKINTYLSDELEQLAQTYEDTDKKKEQDGNKDSENPENKAENKAEENKDENATGDKAEQGGNDNQNENENGGENNNADSGNNNADNANQQQENPPVQNGIEHCFYKKLLETFLKLKTTMINDNADIPLHLPNDKLMSICYYISSFLIEYNNTANIEYYDEILPKHYEDYLKSIETLIIKTLQLPIERKNINNYLKLKNIQVLISLIEEGLFNKNIGTITGNINIFKLYNLTLFLMNELFEKVGFKIRDLDEGFIDALIKLYVFNNGFKYSIRLKLCLEIFKFIKILSNAPYKIDDLDNYYKDNSAMLISQKSKKNTKYNTLFGYRLYQFFNDEVVRKLEIYQTNSYTKKTTIFIRPSITFNSTHQTKKQFLNTVDRSSTIAKLDSLQSETDYFIFEMFYNYNSYTKSRLYRKLKKFQLMYLEYINFAFTIIHQIMLLAYYSRNLGDISNINIFSYDAKLTGFIGNYLFTIFIHLPYVLLVLVFWAFYYFPLSYQYLIMKNYGVHFIFGNTGLGRKLKIFKFTDNFVEDNQEVFDNLNSDIKLIDKAKVVFDIITSNKNIKTFVYCFILLIIFLATSNPLCIVIPVLFITNIFVLLSDLVETVKLKYRELGLVLLFIFLIVYFYSWIGFIYLYSLFVQQTNIIETVIINY